MADKPDKEKATLQSRWESFRTWAEEQWKVLAVAGGFGYVVWALAKDEESRKVFLEFIELGENLYQKASQIYRKLRRGLMMVVGIIVIWSLWISYQAYHMTSLFRPGPFWHTVTHSRGTVLGLAELILFGLLIHFSLLVLPALFGVDFVRGRSEPIPNEGYLEKTLRIVGKFKGWFALAVAIFIATPFWHNPNLLFMALAATPLWPYFCNAWRPGQSEHVRRVLLWLLALYQSNLILLAVFPWLDTNLQTINSSQPHWAAWMMVGWYVLNLVLALYMGGRRTKADAVRDQFVPLVVADQVAGELKDVDKAKAVMTAAGIQPNASTPRSSSGEHMTVGERIMSRQPRAMSPIVAIMITLGAFGLLGWIAGIFNKATLEHKPMIPSEWLFNGNQTLDVVTWAFIGLGVIGVIIAILSQYTPNRR